MKIPERNKGYKEGLINMIKYINQFKPTKDLKIVEVGVWTGCASEIFAKHFHSVICVDLWKNNIGGITNRYDMKEVEKIFDNRAKKYKNIYKNKINSLEIAKVYRLEKDNNIKPDVVYIDAAHDYNNVKNDILAWMNVPKLFLCGHDYGKKFSGVIKAVNEILGKPQKVFKDTSWIFFAIFDI